MVSFIVIYHPRRLNNLQQMLRFLSRRDLQLVKQSELVLVCQTMCDVHIDSSFKEVKRVDLNLDTYCKPKMTNEGVKRAVGDVLVLLDADRILPYGYFTRIIAQLKPLEVVTTQNLFTLSKFYDDSDIDSGNVNKKPDFRSLTNQGRYKNMFSGNTIMWKSDYDKIGGYDENYLGYGFADSDMTRNALVNGLKMVFKQEEELHLYHDKLFDWNNGHIHKDEYRIISAMNALYYCNKWKIEADKGINDLWEEVSSLMNRYRPEHVSRFNDLVAEYYNLQTGAEIPQSKNNLRMI